MDRFLRYRSSVRVTALVSRPKSKPKLPKKVCGGCSQKVHALHAFRRQCALRQRHPESAVRHKPKQPTTRGNFQSTHAHCFLQRSTTSSNRRSHLPVRLELRNHQATQAYKYPGMQVESLTMIQPCHTSFPYACTYPKRAKRHELAGQHVQRRLFLTSVRGYEK